MRLEVFTDEKFSL